VALAAFLLSGAYMRFVARPASLSEGRHLLFLSRHIYVLASALVHLALATYVAPLSTRGARATQWLGSGLLAASSSLLIAAFAAEPMADRARGPASAFGLYTLFAGVMLHLLASTRRRAVAVRPVDPQA